MSLCATSSTLVSPDDFSWHDRQVTHPAESRPAKEKLKLIKRFKFKI